MPNLWQKDEEITMTAKKIVKPDSIEKSMPKKFERPDGVKLDLDQLEEVEKPVKNPVGRPRKEINEDELRQLAAIQCTYAEMAAVFGCSKDTLENNFSAIVEEGRELGRKSLRRLQWEWAKKSYAMAMFLGRQKSWLCQKEEESDQGPIKLIIERSDVPEAEDHV
jgi:hypothetical protein